MFCKKCGSSMKDGSRFCPKCGAENNVVMKQPINPNPYINRPSGYVRLTPAPVPTPSKNTRNTILVIVAMVVVVALIISLFCVFLGGKGKSKVEGCLEASAEGNAKYFVNHVPNDLLDDIMDNYDATKSDAIDCADNYMDYGDWWSCDWEDCDDYEFKNDGKKLSDSRLDDFKEEFEDYMERRDVDLNEFDVDDISAAVKWKVEVDGDDLELYTYKYKGKWYCYSTSRILCYAVYLKS